MLIFLPGFLFADQEKMAEDNSAFKVIREIEFARVEDRSLFLDLYLPTRENVRGLIVYVHAGAWRAGSREDVRILPIVEKGWALASVDYRLSPEAPFPANVHDIKAAIRFLKARAQDFGAPVRPMAIAGSSAGGHLAALIGMTGGHPILEGSVGEYPNESTQVGAIASFYGASNLTTILSQSTPKGLAIRVPALDLLLGGPVEEKIETARLASPVYHVGNNSPALLLFHGDQDIYMPINQAHELVGQYQAAKRDVVFEVIHGAGHGGPRFSDETRIQLLAAFLDEYLPNPSP